MGPYEAAAALGVSVDVVHRLIATGLLDRYRARGGFIRVLAWQVAELGDLPRGYLERC